MTHLNHIKLGLIALLTIIVVVAVFAVEYVDLKRQKALIESIVLEQTGRELQINGAVTANLFPWFGLSLTDVLMANAEEFSDTEFATVSSGELQLYVLPLLTGDIKLKKVVLRGLSCRSVAWISPLKETPESNPSVTLISIVWLLRSATSSPFEENGKDSSGKAAPELTVLSLRSRRA